MHRLTMLALLIPLLVPPGGVLAQDGGIEGLRQTGKAFSAVAKRAAPAVVFVQAEGRAARDGARQDIWPFHDDLFRRFFGDDFPGLSRPAPESPRRTIGQGSGFVFAAGDDTTYIVTNNHVVANADRVRVKVEAVLAERGDGVVLHIREGGRSRYLSLRWR